MDAGQDDALREFLSVSGLADVDLARAILEVRERSMQKRRHHTIECVVRLVAVKRVPHACAEC